MRFSTLQNVAEMGMELLKGLIFRSWTSHVVELLEVELAGRGPDYRSCSEKIFARFTACDARFSSEQSDRSFCQGLKGIP